MRNAWAIRVATDEVLETSAQLGVKDIVVYGGPGAGVLPGTADSLRGPRATYDDYAALRDRLGSYGLRIAAFEGGFAGVARFMEIVFGGPRRDERIEELIGEIRDMARAGAPIYGYHWMPKPVWRSANVRIRGGAEATALDWDRGDARPLGDDPLPTWADLGEERMWRNLEYWIRAVTPVAEEEGIRLGIHPPDPPVRSLGGVPSLLWSFEAYKRLVDIYPSDSNGIEFCQGTFSEMNEDIYEMIEYFARRRKVLYVHFRNVSGQVPKFNEEFINTGYVDMHRAMRAYRDAGYDGVFIDDHCPLLTGDVEFPGNWGGYRSRMFAQGYIQALIESVTKEASG